MVGRIEKVPLRDVWKKEAKDFTDWLFDNIEVLAEELEISFPTVYRLQSRMKKLREEFLRDAEVILL